MGRADDELLADLTQAAETGLARHLQVAREWLPHELVPWGRGRDFATGELVDESAAALPVGVRSALVVNLLTEDALPFYTAGLIQRLGQDHPWDAWIRRWTAEEMRHATVIRDYLTVSRSVDPTALERQRMTYICSAPVPVAPSVAQALVYLAMQELATRIAHRNAGAGLADPTGTAIMSRVAADENLHHIFYRDLVTAAMERDPCDTVIAIDAQVRHFGMPGAAIPGFADHLRRIAEAGIYSAEIMHSDVLTGLVRRHWQLDQVTGLSDEAERARERVVRFIDRFGRIAPRLPGGSAGTGGSA